MKSASPSVHPDVIWRSLRGPNARYARFTMTMRVPPCAHQRRTFIRHARIPTRAFENFNVDRMRQNSYDYHVRRRNFLLCGAISGVVAFVYTAWLLKKELEKPTKMDSGLPGNLDPFKTEAGTVRKTVVHDEKGREIVPTGNSTVPTFPRTLDLDVGAADSLEARQGVEYTLVGLGLRTVSFLGIQVYIVGYYIATPDIADVQSRLIKEINPIATTLVPSERDELRRRLLDPVEGEKLWLDILDTLKVRSVFRIVPVRDTDFHHLRDGFVRTITGQTMSRPKEFEDDAFRESMKEFRAVFNRGRVPKNHELLLARDEKGALTILYDGGKKAGTKMIGQVQDERISRALWLNYVAGTKVASEPARKNIVEGIMEFVERPVGTVATQVL